MKIQAGTAIACFLIGLAGYFIAKWLWPNGGATSMETLAIAVGWGGAILVGLLGLAVVYKMFTGGIDLTKLVSEANGDASMSRFQFLIFTFVIALCLLLITIGNKDGPQFPKTIPPEILGLLGISAGSYVVSKSLQNNLTVSQSLPAVTVAADPASVIVGKSSTITATATGSGTLTFQWQRLSPGNTNWQCISGETKPTLVVTPASVAEDKTQYRCTVSNANGDTVSQAITLPVTPERG